jgi:hypothetical protein
MAIARRNPPGGQKAQMARYFRIRCIIKTGQTNPPERIQAICGVNPDGSHWTLTQDQAVSQIERGISVFYIERRGSKRVEVVVAMDFHANKYLKAVAGRDQGDELLYLPPCRQNFVHLPMGRSMEAGI